MLIATVSLDQVWEDKKKNYLICKKYVREASSRGSDLIIFPEMTLTGFSTNLPHVVEDSINSGTIEQFKYLAKSNNIAIVFGVVLKNGRKAMNHCVFVDKNGDVKGMYAKIHLFSSANEDLALNPGNKLVIIDFLGVNIGLTICYDLRFPEIYSALSKRCDLIINIANWPEKRIDHWNTLLKARAIENQVIIVGVNRIGIDGNNLKYKESSKAYNACGDDILTSGTFNGMNFYILDKKVTEEYKQLFNTTIDRRPEFYKSIL